MSKLCFVLFPPKILKMMRYIEDMISQRLVQNQVKTQIYFCGVKKLDQ